MRVLGEADLELHADLQPVVLDPGDVGDDPDALLEVDQPDREG